MPSNPPAVADLEAEVATECGLMLADTGLYLRSPDATTPAIRIGLRKGAKAVMLTLTDPLALADSDVAVLSGFAIERVLDEAKLHALQWVLLNWHRATMRHQEPLSSTPVISGYLVDEKRAVKDRVSELKAICDEPYREPSDPTVVVGRLGETRPTVAAGQIPVVVGPGYTGQAYPYGDGYPYGHGYGNYGYGGGWGFGWEGGEI